MGGNAKIKLSYCLLSRVFGNRFSKDLGPRLVAIFSSSRGSEATSKAIGIKYTYDEGSESNANPPPLNFPILGPQWEGSGRESLTRRATPQRGVGGYCLRISGLRFTTPHLPPPTSQFPNFQTLFLGATLNELLKTIHRCNHFLGMKSTRGPPKLESASLKKRKYHTILFTNI